MEQKNIGDPWFNKPFNFLSTGLQNLFFGLSDGVQSTTSEYMNLINIKRRNSDLEKEMIELKARLNVFNENQIELERLRTLLDFQKNTKMELIPAQVIGRDLVTDHNTITINKGTDHGLKHGQAVLTVSGAVGYIYKPTSKTAHILLITDRYSVVDAIIQKSRARGLIEGKSNDLCSLQYVERTEDVKDGDLIVTGGLDNIFPKGFPIGVITSVSHKTKSVSLQIEVKPVVDANRVEEVFVVKSAASENFLPDSQEPKLESETTEASKDKTQANANE